MRDKVVNAAANIEDYSSSDFVRIALIHTRLLYRGGLETRLWSYMRYLQAQGIDLEHGLLAAEAAEVMRRYREDNGLVYNG